MDILCLNFQILNGKAERFQAVVGLDDSCKVDQKGRFRVLNEDFFGNQVLFDSGNITRDNPPIPVDISVKGVGYILLMFDGRRAAGDWADVKVVSGK